ncbi:MAG: class C sortase [Candidatus Onthomonas sp.]
MKRILMPLCYGAAILLGFLLLSYPMISNYLYEQRQDGVIARYETLAQDTALDETRKKALEAARKYNRQLASGVVSLEDPFLTATIPEKDGTQSSILDITGTGVIATLEVPALNLELPVYYGTDSETLEHGVGVLEISSLPVGGEGTHTVLCGHSGLSAAKLFSDLEQLEVGDQFYIEVLGETLAYKVDQISTVLPEDLSQLAIDPQEDYCTLLTCTPYGVNTHRLLVRGVRTVLSAESDEAADNTEETAPSVWLKEYLRSLAVSVLVVLVFFILGQLIAAAWRRYRRLK